MEKIKTLVRILGYVRYGTTFKSRIELILLSVVQVALYPLFIASKSTYDGLFFRFSNAILKDSKVLIDGKRYVVSNGNDFLILTAEWKLKPFFEPQFEGVFVDVGGHLGKYTIGLSDKFREIISLEANIGNYQKLKENIQINGLSEKVKLFNLAAFDRSGEILKLNLTMLNSGGHSLISGEKTHFIGEQKIETTTVDDLLRKTGTGFDSVSLVKIDVEGAELHVLKGTRELLEKGRSKLIIEIWENDEKRLKEIFSYLGGFGYEGRKIMEDNFVFERNDLNIVLEGERPLVRAL